MTSVITTQKQALDKIDNDVKLLQAKGKQVGARRRGNDSQRSNG